MTSIIIPAYNCASYIDHCLESVLGQTETDLEVLVIDDGSTDKTPAMLDAWAEKDARLKVIHQPNAGVASARNKGLDLATGTYVTFVDSDDYLAEDYIEKLKKRIEETGAEMIVCGLQFVKPDGTVINTVLPDHYERFTAEEWTARVSCVAAHFYKRELWERYHVRFMSGERGEDMPIALFFSAVCDKIGVLPEAGYYYVQHEASAMHNFRGLKNYQLPYHSLSKTVRSVEKVGAVNSREFYGLFVLRILSTCYFDLARGADAAHHRQLCAYIEKLLKEYFPDYRKNPRARLIGNRTRVPFAQKAAVWLLCRLTSLKLLYPFARLVLR